MEAAQAAPGSNLKGEFTMSETGSAPLVARYVPEGAATNSLAIISLVMSVVGLGLVGVITGHISLGQIKRTHEQGRGLA